MSNRNVIDNVKNAVGTVFLLAAAFFMCSTFLSVRAVFADPIAPTPGSAAANAAATPVTSGRASPRSTAASRTTNPSRSTTSRATVSRATVARPASTTTSRATTSSRGVTSRATAATSRATTQSRNVVSRGATTRTATRNIVSRNATPAAQSRVSLLGTAMRGSKAAITNNTTYTYLSNKLYTGNYSNIIDSSTGLISADAYQNCLESYYTCMDEICTARSAAKRRCSCAARVTNFIEAEEQLESANEELIKVSGELALLIANKGKDVSEAFQLTDAEKVMNCVSWQETTSKYGVGSDEAKQWCYAHGFYGSGGGMVSSCAKPSYCSTSGNNFGFDVTNIEGSSSDILASLQAWADAKDKSLSYVQDDTTNLLSAYTNVSSIVADLAGITTDNSETTVDSLAQTWGYDLFEYAHNNVCSRVLDSCFNGIYEGCGTPPSGGKCADGGTGSCPYNYNSKITVSSSGDVELNERGSSIGSSSTTSATCFGYASTSGDPYASLRGPVADARRSVMQKYLLDANADCDSYGEDLKTMAQNIGYQKVAAQQALQQKRLEFYNEEVESIATAAITAGTNFNECLSEIYDCYETQSNNTTSSGAKWTTARIRTYCAQASNVPHCYEPMICNPSTSQFRAIIDETDSATCSNSQDYTKNTCRNIVTLNEILNGVNGASDVTNDYPIAYTEPTSTTNGKYTGTGNSAKIREKCLLDAGVEAIRIWPNTVEDTSQSYNRYVGENGWSAANATYSSVNCTNSGGDWDEPTNSCKCMYGYAADAYANCKPITYTVTVNTGDGKSYAYQYKYGTVTTIDATPKKYGYVFVGWCRDTQTCDTPSDAPFTVSATDSGDFTLYAVWKTEAQDTCNTDEGTWNTNTQTCAYTIAYNLNGGNWGGASGASQYTAGIEYTIPTSVTRTGYTFAGWCTDSGLTNCAASQTISATATGNKTFYAKWTANTYSITYNLQGGQWSDANVTTSYTYGVGATISKVPTRELFTFAGWCTDSGLTNCAASQTISATATGNKTFYAKWTAKSSLTQDEINKIYSDASTLIRYLEDGACVFTLNEEDPTLVELTSQASLCSNKIDNGATLQAQQGACGGLRTKIVAAASAYLSEADSLLAVDPSAYRECQVDIRRIYNTYNN